MERHYLLSQVWGRRETHNPDVEAAVARVSDRHYHRCLDVGSGLGHYAELLSPLCDEVIGIDISERAVERARRRLSHMQNVHFRVANIRTLKSERPFDLIVLGDVLYYLGDIHFPEAFAELARGIRDMTVPNGRILITTFVTRGRTYEQALAYGKLFEAIGMHAEHSETFAIGNRRWVFQLLTH